jgi:signal transduction histidine kinase
MKKSRYFWGQKMKLVIALLLSIINGYGQAINIIGSSKSYFPKLDNYSIYVDSTAGVSISTINNFSSKFVMKGKTYGSPTKNNYWLKFLFKNATAQKQNFRFIYGGVFANELIVYQKIGNGYKMLDKPHHWKISANYDTQQNMRMPSYLVNFEANEQIEILVKIVRKDRPTPDLTFIMNNEANFLDQEKFYKLFFGIFIGFCSCIALFTLVLFCFLRESIFLYYTAAVVFIMFFNAAIEGMLRLYFPNIQTYFTGPYSSPYFFILFLVFNLLYIEKFLEIRRTKLFNAWLIGTAIFYILPFLYEPLLYNQNWVNGRYYVGLPFLAFLIYFLVKGVKEHPNLVMFLVVSLLPLLATNIYFNLSAVGLFKYDPNIIYWRKLSVMFEFIIILVGIAYQYIRTRKHLKKLRLSLIDSQKEIINIQDIERDRIGRELHDQIGNSLASLKLSAGNITNQEVLNEQINAIIASTRSISHNMVSSNFKELALSTSVSDMVARFSESSDINYLFNVFGVEKDLDIEKKMFLFRILLECMSNIEKHSQAKNAYIQLSFFDTELNFTVEDDGIGFDKNAENSGGIGLKNINSRINYLKGSFSIDSNSQGTVIAINIPI